MGLDMFLYRAKKDSSFSSANDYLKVSNNESRYTTEVGYWRKANHIHNWFVENIQNGIDDQKGYFVNKNQIEILNKLCKDIISKKVKPQSLPTKSGFFFGSTEYDEYYYNDLKETVRIIDSVLETTDFEKEVIIYTSWW